MKHKKCSACKNSENLFSYTHRIVNDRAKIQRLQKILQKEREQHQLYVQDLHDILHEERTNYNEFLKEMKVLLSAEKRRSSQSNAELVIK